MSAPPQYHSSTITSPLQSLLRQLSALRMQPFPRRAPLLALAIIVVFLLITVSSSPSTTVSHPAMHDQNGAAFMSKMMSAAPMPAMERSSRMMMETQESSPADFANNDGGGPVTRMLIKTGDLQITVPSAQSEKACHEVEVVVKDLEGYVERSSSNNHGWVTTWSFTVRVPENKFETAMNDLAAIAKETAGAIRSKSMNQADVTEEYVDRDARQRSLTKTQEQLLKLLERATNVGEVLEVQRELASINQQIESQKARLVQLKRLSSMASINMYIETQNVPAPPSEPWINWSPFRTVSMSIRGIVWVFTLVVDILIYASFWVAPCLGIYYLYLKYRPTSHSAPLIPHDST